MVGRLTVVTLPLWKRLYYSATDLLYKALLIFGMAVAFTIWIISTSLLFKMLWMPKKPNWSERPCARNTLTVKPDISVKPSGFMGIWESRLEIIKNMILDNTIEYYEGLIDALIMLGSTIGILITIFAVYGSIRLIIMFAQAKRKWLIKYCVLLVYIHGSMKKNGCLNLMLN